MRTARKQRRDAAPQPEWISPRDAADLLGIGRGALSTLAIQGRVRTETRGRFLFYFRDSVLELKKELEQERSSKS